MNGSFNKNNSREHVSKYFACVTHSVLRTNPYQPYKIDIIDLSIVQLRKNLKLWEVKQIYQSYIANKW